MNIIIYTVVILTIFYFLLKLISNISSKKLSKGLRILVILGLILMAVLFAIGGKFLLTLPLTLASLALLKLKGLSIFQLISLFRLIQTLRRSGRFSFNQSNSNNLSSISVSEAYKILNLDIKKNDNVIVPAITFVSTANAVIYNSANVILSDIDNDTLNISQKNFPKVSKISKDFSEIIILQEAITGIRNIRSEMLIPQKLQILPLFAL